MSEFAFKAQWKEELVVTGEGGSFKLELPMGVPAAYLPTEDAWKKRGPAWAKDLWPSLKEELQAWCRANGARFVEDETAQVYDIVSKQAP
jgi:hypothetical protein